MKEARLVCKLKTVITIKSVIYHCMCFIYFNNTYAIFCHSALSIHGINWTDPYHVRCVLVTIYTARLVTELIPRCAMQYKSYTGAMEPCCDYINLPTCNATGERTLLLLHNNILRVNEPLRYTKNAMIQIYSGNRKRRFRDQMKVMRNDRWRLERNRRLECQKTRAPVNKSL